jgi:hypothetical protein
MIEKRMLPRFVAGLLGVVAIVILLVAGAAPVSAQGNPPLWFQFNVGSVDPDEITSHVSVVLRDQPQCKGGFQVYTAESWSYWGASTQGDPVGRSNSIGADMHMWASELVPGAYYVRLGSGAGPGCVLGVSGKTVDYVGLIDRGWGMAERNRTFTDPVEAAPAQTKMVVEQTPASKAPVQMAIPLPLPAADVPAMAAQPVMPAFHEMEHDMEMVPNEWMPVTNNDPMWFEFKVGHVPDDSSSSVSVTLYSGPFRAGRFEIFTAEGKPFNLPEQDDWFGKADSAEGEFAAWYGNLVPGAYYVLVYPEGMKNCMLSVSGRSITF